MLPEVVLQFLTLILVTMGGTGLLKKLAASLGTKLGGPAAVILSWAVAGGVTILSVANGWVTLPDLACGADLLGACLISVLQAALAVATFANLAYVYIYEAVFNVPDPLPVAIVPATSTAAIKAVDSTTKPA